MLGGDIDAERREMRGGGDERRKEMRDEERKYRK